jgi:hypothetical protein
MMEGRVEAGDLREVRLQFPHRGYAGKVVWQVERRKRDEPLQPNLKLSRHG